MKKFSELTLSDMLNMDPDVIIRLAINEIQNQVEEVSEGEPRRVLQQSIWALRSEIKKEPEFGNKVRMIKGYISQLRLMSRGEL